MPFEKPDFCLNGDNCVDFNTDFIAKICAIADEVNRLRCEVQEWTAGTQERLTTCQEQFYLANPDGDPANNMPCGDSGANWIGPFCSLGKVIEHMQYDKTVISSYAVTNPPGDGDDTITITVTQTEQPSGTVLDTSTITLQLENGAYLGGVESFNETTGIITFNVVDDDNESIVSTQSISLENWLQNQFVGSGASSVTWTGDSFTISSTDRHSTLTAVTDTFGNDAWLYQQLDNDGDPIGTPTVITDTRNTSGSSDGSISITETPKGDGSFHYDFTISDQNTRYSFDVVNDYDGDGIIQIRVTATEPNGTTSTSLIEITETEREQGQYFSGQPTLTGGTGILTFPTVQDEGEAAGTPFTVNLESWLQNQIIGSGDTSVTWNGSQFVVSSTSTVDTDQYQTVTTNPDGSVTFQLVDKNGTPTGTPTTLPPDTRNTVGSSNSSVTVTPTTKADGSLHYDLTIPCVQITNP